MSRVLFRFCPARPVSSVDLRGDMIHWWYPTRMRAARDGYVEAELSLEPGTYAYKFHLSDDEWAVDPSNPRTRTRDGVRNSLLVVGGAEEPVLHAPASPYVVLDDDGRMCVRAGLRRGCGGALAVRFDEGDGPRAMPMRHVADEDEHSLFEAALPGSGAHVDYWFILADGRCIGRVGGGGQGFRVARKQLARSTPAWWRDAIVYSIFVDRFRRGGRDGVWTAPDRYDRDYRAGGDLRGVIEALPHLVDLGVTALHLTPICDSPSVHRYDAADPRRVDAELGGDSALDELLDRAHERGLRVILDVTVTHVDREMFAFRDVRENGPASRYWDWFRIHSYPFHDGPKPGYEHYQKGQWREPLLRTDNPEVADFLVGTARAWATRGADGVRVDAASDVPHDLVARIVRAVRGANPEAAVFGEVIPDNLDRWTADLDAATDFPAQEALLDWLLRDRRTSAQLGRALAHRRFTRGGPGWTSIAFTATHDQPRLRSRTGDAQLARLGQLVVLMRQAVPMLYYGDEIGLQADHTGRNFEDSWPDRQCMPWTEDRWDDRTLELVRRATHLRRAHPALRRGDEDPINTGIDDVFAFRRSRGGEAFDVFVNRGESSYTIPATGELVLSTGDASLGSAAIRLGPRSAAVVRRPTERASVLELAANRALAVRAHSEGSLITPSLPANLYITVTEACNLQCVHCITGAPERTRTKRARHMRPWVVDALRESFASAEYFAFTHGGESLTAPVLWDVLAAIAQERGALRYDVHLVTNGMLLDAPTTERLIDNGVTSLMVSLDGATPATNDSIRAGGSLARVVDNIVDALDVRRRTGADLRIGISTVVGRTNVHELTDIGRLAASLGVDWLKIEETYPATSFARADLLAPRSARVRAAMESLRAAVADAELVVVDHVDPPSGCRCQCDTDPALERFRDADDYANRVTFHPCRAPWEQACVDPDGTVHPVDYAQPAIGSLLEATMRAIWNGEAAQRARERASARLAS